MTSTQATALARPVGQRRLAAAASSSERLNAWRTEPAAALPADAAARQAMIALAEREARQLSREISKLEAHQARIGLLRRQRENLINWIVRQAASEAAGLRGKSSAVALAAAACAAAIVVGVTLKRTGGDNDPATPRRRAKASGPGGRVERAARQGA